MSKIVEKFSVKNLKKIGKLSFLSALTAGLISCGGSSNNDQGTSFLAYGYFKDSTGDIGQTGDYLVLGGSTQGKDSTDPVIAYIGLQNFMTSQFIRVTRIECSYDVAGAAPGFSIPNDSFNSSIVISAAPSTNAPITDNTPPSVGDGSTAIMGFTVVAPDITTYLDVNRNQLPELPYRMNVNCHAVGMTQAGDVLETNPLTYQILVVEPTTVVTPGSGGGVSYIDGNTATNQ